MKKIEMPIEITFLEYGSEYKGFVVSLSSVIDAADYTDDEWNILPEYKYDYDFICDVNHEYNGPNEPKIIRREDILHECFEEPVLYSRWGYVEPAEGSGLSDCGREPDYYAIDENGETHYFF